MFYMFNYPVDTPRHTAMLRVEGTRGAKGESEAPRTPHQINSVTEESSRNTPWKWEYSEYPEVEPQGSYKTTGLSLLWRVVHDFVLTLLLLRDDGPSQFR